MAEPIRILHVIGAMNRGGAENMIMNLYRQIDKTKVQFDFAVCTPEPAAFDDEILSLGGQIHRLPRYNGKNHFTYTKWWHKFFKAHGKEYTVIHGHIGSTAAIYLSIAKKYGLYTVAHSHNTKANLIYRIYSYPTRFIADHFFTCSMSAGLSRYGKGVAEDSNRCTLLNNAIDVKKYLFNEKTRANVRNFFKITDDVTVIGHVGRFDAQKNHIYLVDLFKKYLEKDNSAILMLVGDGELREKIRAHIEKNGLKDNVILTGVCSNVQDLLQAMDVFVMPSLFEGLPVSMVEAQAAGLPCCVSTNVPRDSAITDLVEFIPLEKDFKIWTDRIAERAKLPRKNMYDAICDAGFDIVYTAKWLQSFYLSKKDL